MPTVMVTFAQATFILATFVHIWNISAVADLILTKFLHPCFGGPWFLWIKIFWTKCFLTQTFLHLNCCGPKMFLDPKIFGPKFLFYIICLVFMNLCEWIVLVEHTTYKVTQNYRLGEVIWRFNRAEIVRNDFMMNSYNRQCMDMDNSF